MGTSIIIIFVLQVRTLRQRFKKLSLAGVEIETQFKYWTDLREEVATKKVGNAVKFLRINVSPWLLRPAGIGDQIHRSRGSGQLPDPQRGPMAPGKARRVVRVW